MSTPPVLGGKAPDLPGVVAEVAVAAPLRGPTVHRLRMVLRLKLLAPPEAPAVAHPAQASRTRRTGRLQ
jgi:hypothetical protein